MKSLHHLTARRRFLIKTSAAAVVGAAVLPLTGTSAVAATSHTFRHGHAQLGKLPAGVRPAPRIDTALAGAKGQVTVMLQLTRRAAIRAYLHPSGATTHSARQSAFRQQTSADRAQQREVAAHFDAAATKATQLYTLHAGYNGIAVRTDASRLAALSRLPGVVAVHRIAALHPLNNVTVPLIKANDVWASAGVGNDVGNGMTIGIIDTGMDYTHADFGGPGTTGAYDTAKTNDTKPLTDPAVSGLYDSAKFAGGFDLAGDNYDALAGQPGDQAGDPNPEDAIPVPDQNPLDCNSHGTHTAGTAAGYGVLTNGNTGKGFDYSTLGGQSDLGSTFKVGPGVAPGAKIFSVKVFGCAEGADSEIVPEAIDALISQNATGKDVNGNDAPHIDVISMSLGGDYASAQDPTASESNAAVDAGIQVVSAAGNAGDVFDVLGSPGNAVKGIGVAASDDTQDITDALKINSPAAIMGNVPGEESIAFDWAGMSSPITGDLATTGDITQPPSGTNNADGCDPITQDLTGKVAYFSWTDNDALRRCGSAGRTANAADAGAIGAVFFDDRDEFSAGITGASSIPSMLITQSAGQSINQQLAAAQTVNVSFDNTLHNTQKNDHPNTANAIATFSSRGDDYAGNLKPDVSAPGQTVFSAGMGTGNDGLTDSGTSMATPHVAGVAALVASEHSADTSWTALDTKAAIVNTATQDVYTRDANNNADQSADGIEAPMRVGAGRVNALDAVNTTSLAYVDDNSGAVAVSFGTLDVTQATQTFSKQVRIVNTSNAANTYTATYNSIDDMPGASYSVTPSTPVTIPAGGHADVTVTLTTHRDQLIERPDSTLDQNPLGLTDINNNPLERSFIADTSGNLVVTPTAGTALRVPVYAAPRPSSSMHAPASVAISGGKGTLTLGGTGIDNTAALNTSGQPGDALSQSTLDAFELQGTSPALKSVPFSDERAGDLRAVGFASDGPLFTQAHADPFADGGFGYFGIQTWGPWHTPASYEQFDVLIDTDGNGGPDAVLYNDRLATPQQGEDYFVATLEDVRPGPTNGEIIDQEFVDNTDGSQDLEEFDSDVIDLPFALGALEAVGYDPSTHPRIQYSVDAFTEEEGFTDSIGDPYNGQTVMSVDPAQPALMASDVTDNPPSECAGLTACYPAFNPDQPGDKLTVLTKASQLAGDKPLGLLLFHFNNAKGNHAQVVKVASSVTLKLAKTTVPFGYRDHATVTVKSGAGTPTGSVSLFNGSTKIGSGALHSGVAHLTLPALSVGTHNIKAVYAGNNLLAGASASKKLKVTKAKTHTSLSTHPAHPSAGGSVTLKAVTRVVSPGHAPVSGRVTFFDGSKKLGKATSHGTATFKVHGLSAGTHHFRAVYGGSSNTAGSSGSHSVAI